MGNTTRGTRENWLLEVGNLPPGGCLYVYPRGELHSKEAQPALDAQYGRGEFEATIHGNAFRVWRRLPEPRRALQEASHG